VLRNVKSSRSCNRLAPPGPRRSSYSRVRNRGCACQHRPGRTGVTTGCQPALFCVLTPGLTGGPLLQGTGGAAWPRGLAGLHKLDANGNKQAGQWVAPPAKGRHHLIGESRYPVTDAVRDAISKMPAWAWQVACNADGDFGEHADVIEIIDVLDLSRWAKHCPGMHVIVRRELPHPGATLDVFEIRDGHRYQAFTTNSRRGQLAFLEARHRAHARVEYRIRTGKDTGLGPQPSRHQNINQVWVELALIAADLFRPRPVHPPDRPARPAPRGTQDAALPAAAHRRPHHPRAAQSPPAPGRALALGPGPRRSVHPPAADPAPGPTASTAALHHPTKSTETPDPTPAITVALTPPPRHSR